MYKREEKINIFRLQKYDHCQSLPLRVHHCDTIMRLYSTTAYSRAGDSSSTRCKVFYNNISKYYYFDKSVCSQTPPKNKNTNNNISIVVDVKQIKKSISMAIFQQF